MGHEVLKKFGRYFLLDCIAQGGMAEIFRARLAAPDGAARLVVIKRILAGYGRNKDFHKMFQSETKVMMAFNHPSIVQLYDFGEVKGQPYIAMELVDGRNLRQFISRVVERKEKFPIDLGVHIIEQVAGGLQYAHTFKDKLTGEPLNLIHRDVSPQNILCSYDGNVKIIDFGIAKANTNSEATRVGIIKGKPSYLSPEQISGEGLDARSDIFATGTVLWEVLTGKKLFAAPKGENEFAVLKLIESCNTYVKPPSTINPNIPKELDAIVMKALAKKRGERYQTCEELQRALHRFLYTFFPDFNPSDLAYVSKRFFKDQIVEDRKKLQALNGKAEQLLEGDVSIFGNGSESIDVKENQEVTFVDPRIGANKEAGNRGALEISKIRTNQIELENLPKMPERPPEKKSAGPGGAGGDQPAELQAMRGRRGPRQRPPRKDPKKVVQAAREKGGARQNNILVRAASLGVAALILVIVFGDKIGIQLPGMPVAPVETGMEGDGGPSLNALKRSNESIRIRLNIKPGFPGMKINLNGARVDEANPVVKVVLDSPLELTVTRKGFKTFRREFVLSSTEYSGIKETIVDVPLDPIRFGYLSIQSTPSADATIRPVDEKNRNPSSGNAAWILKTPIEREKMPVGTYSIKLENRVLGMEKNVVIKVQEGRSHKVNERLEIQP